jgi:hypothetical protein
MKKIQIHRVKYFAASFHIYDVVVKYDNGIEERHPLKNGQTISVELEDRDCLLSIWYHSFNQKTRYQISNTYFVKYDESDLNLVFDKDGKGFSAIMILKKKPIDG